MNLGGPYEAMEAQDELDVQLTPLHTRWGGFYPIGGNEPNLVFLLFHWG
jgi:hypothetical protein